MTIHRLPDHFDATTLPDFLASIGLLNAGIASAITTKNLSASGVRYSEKQIDEALDKTGLSNVDRIAVKLEVYQNRLMGS